MNKIIIPLIFFSCFFMACHTLGMDNFLEFDKTETVFYDIDFTIIYSKKCKSTDESFLIIKYPSEESEKIIFQGHFGHIIDELLVDNENKRLAFSLRDIRIDSYYYYLILFDLVTMEIIERISVMNTIKEIQKDDFLYDLTGIGAYISIDEINKKIIFPIFYRYTREGNNFIPTKNSDRLVFDINTGFAEIIAAREIRNYYQLTERASTYASQDVTRVLFWISPGTKYQGQKYRRRYYGVYINDGNNNIRISRKYGVNGYGKIFWLDDGKYVICGSYLFDTSGILKKLRIIDGEVLAIF